MKISKPFLIKLLPFFLVAVLSFGAGFIAKEQWQDAQLKRIATEDEATVSALNKIIVLPEELPSVATVSDKSKLLDQPFFMKAENGDKVIIYTENRRAYLFRPSEQRIIDMTVIATEPPSSDSLPVFKTNTP